MTNLLKYVIVSVQKQRGTKKPLIKELKMEKEYNRNRSYFIGVGAYSSDLNSIMITPNEYINKERTALKGFCRFFSGEYIGVFSGDKGIYIEKALVFHEDNVTLETLKGCYTKEECFYQAEIVSEELVCKANDKELYKYLIEAISNLYKYDGFTLKIKDGYVYKLITVEGELLR